MNCFAHAVRFLDDPWFMLGTGLPDWLSMADRAVRLRPRHLDALAAETADPPLTTDHADSTASDDTCDDTTALARGVRQHWHDDDWFHASRAFHEVSSEIGVMFRRDFNTGDNFRAGFLGHIAMELLIDGVLTEHQPQALDDYYAVVESADGHRFQQLVNGFGARPTEALLPFLDRYLSEQFLRDYVDDERLLYRLNRVLARVRLPPLPHRARQVIGKGRTIVRERLPELLTTEFLSELPTAAAADGGPVRR